MAKFVPFIIKTDGSQNISVKIVRMKKSDAVQTEKEPVWQTSWLSDYIQDDVFEKYALKTSNGELVALAAYEILENDVMVHIAYIESQPESNPTIVGHSKKYQGIGRVLIAYGIKLQAANGRAFLGSSQGDNGARGAMRISHRATLSFSIGI